MSKKPKTELAKRFKLHPEACGIGFSNGHKFPTDEQYLRQLQAYADWHGVELTKKEICSRPWLLEKLR